MFVPGQRWISTAEPELGLGTVLRVEGRGVQVLFAKAGVLRPYAIDSAPLVRAEFRPGQRVAGKGIAFLVERVEVREELLVYRGEGRELEEGQLDDEQSVSQADDRLIGGRTDPVSHFELRLEGLKRRAEARRSPAWGLGAARIGLVPHQLRVAGIAASRRPPRVLLADEVGLGKTIEAGMIIARQLATGRAGRVLLLLPDTLVYQWFVELLRRFNLSFAIYDEERCEALEQSDGANPFEDEQLVIADFTFLEQSPKRAQQLLDARWDLLVVDEAHHLAWTPEAASPRYTLVDQLAAATPGVILLTATPEQLGRSGHFARLRLLDPQRYHDLDAYLSESDTFHNLSKIADRLLESQPLDDAQRATLRDAFAGDETLLARLADTAKPENAHEILAALIDRHGTGRAMFRNRRASIGGFPKRIPVWHLIDKDTLSDNGRQALLAEFHADMQQPAPAIEIDYGNDPRIDTLVALLEAHPQDKFLLICRSQAKVLALEEALRTKSGVGLARFHEGLGIVQRDRNAAYFAQPDGARLLLCSEIGSEGRNFQFAHRLVLWDLPLDPDLLEQRIGRLDRIGQKHDISIHVLAIADSAQHVLARWYDEGIDAFRVSPADGRELLRRFGEPLARLADEHARGDDNRDQELDVLLAETRGAHEEMAALIRDGRDHLLELAASRDLHADELQQAFTREDNDPSRDAFIQSLLERFGIHAEELGGKVLLLDPQYLSTDALPGFSEGPQAVTFARDVALAREELPLLRLDHPMVMGALDLTLSNEQGNAAFLVDDVLPPRSALLQAVFLIECVADRKLDAERFLPPQPIVVTIDTRLAERADFRPSDIGLRKAADRTIEVARYRKFLGKLVPPMLEKAEAIASERAKVHVDEAVAQATDTLDAELSRLLALRAVNPAISEAEISTVADERTAMLKALPGARLRLDAVRFVVSPDFLALR
ncbi:MULTISPECIES: RNA polymerase-associated protein RapA [unclassified Dyella]|uniref:RNA polymerase-associated protein RapA n=1 Tax=unclassified Dyella TaxID=2634549 RepID=UPI000C857D06|nr:MULTISPECIES: RNA polymerase-associated protein RapA [unclassified Dyella]MDR3444588.1 RNA polymerase-associated protein RapA [Dyella sp.]PMQ05646.1 RNA polymerase-associated protein RapA [Dyella sp. AD56]